MRTASGLVALGALLCSCTPPAPPQTTTSLQTAASAPSSTIGAKFSLGDGWSVQVLTIDSRTAMCRGEITQPNPPVTLYVYFPQDTSKPNSPLQLLFVAPQSLTGPVSDQNLFVVRINGEVVAHIDPDDAEINQGMALLGTAPELGTTLADKFARARTLELAGTSALVPSLRQIVTLTVPRAGALLRSLVACEQSSLSEAATRAAYNRGT